MSYAHYQSPFWEFIRPIDLTGAGVDHSHPPPYPGQGANWFMAGQLPRHSSFDGSFGPNTEFAGAGWGRRSRDGCHGMRGRRGSRGHCGRDAPPEPSKDNNDNSEAAPAYDASEGPEGAAANHHADGAEGTESKHSNGPHRHCRDGPRHWGRSGCRRAGSRRGFPFSPDGAFDMSTLMEHFSHHPIAQAIRSYAQQYASQRDGEFDSFVPPVDIFVTPDAFILHVALPGAKKEDVGVNWNPDKNEVVIAGVVYRPGDEEFIKNLKNAERRVGMFERSVRLPPAGDATEQDKTDEIDGDNITAKLEDGVLIVTVPKVEKEWTDIKKVDIE